MSNTPFDHADADIETSEPALEQPADGKQDMGWAGWLISFAIHASLLVIMYLVVFGTPHIAEDPPAVRVVDIAAPKPVEDKTKRTDLDETKIEVPIKQEAEVPSPVSSLDMEVTKHESEDENDAVQPKGREEAVANAEMGGQGAFMAVGAGPGSAGMMGFRKGGGRKRGCGLFGGTPGSEAAVDRGLRWLKRHQSLNGMWDAVNYTGNCDENPKCEPGANSSGNVSAALTGYAVLCFLGAGYDTKSPNKYRETVRRGVDYLLAAQQADGSFGRNYENGICAMAIAEAYAMSGDPDLKEPAQKAMDVIIATQAADPGAADAAYGKLGWDYGKANPDRNDSSVSGWNVMALKSGLAAGLEVTAGLNGAKHWLDVVWKATNPGWEKLDPYTDESRFPYVYKGSDKSVQIGKPGDSMHDLACVGLVSAAFLGHQPGDQMLGTLANYVSNHQQPKTWADLHLYYSYYNTMGMFQVGGDQWKVWNGTVRDLFVDNQRVGDGCFDGSWNFADTKEWHGREVGRVLSTVYCILSLEVYYRYDQVAGKQVKGKGKAPAKLH
jgi:hypothetical protein